MNADGPKGESVEGQTVGRVLLWLLAALLLVMALQLILAPGDQGLWLGVPCLLGAVYIAVRLRRRQVIPRGARGHSTG